MTELENLRGKLSLFGQRAGLPPKAIWIINLVLDELFTNIVSYGCEDRGNDTVRFTISRIGDDLFIKMEDTCIPFNPLTSEPPDMTCGLAERCIGGIGLHLVRQMMDHLQYRRHRNTNILEMKKSLSDKCAGRETEMDVVKPDQKTKGKKGKAD